MVAAPADLPVARPALMVAMALSDEDQATVLVMSLVELSL